MALICLHLHNLTSFVLYFSVIAAVAHSGQATLVTTNNQYIGTSGKFNDHYNTASGTVFNVLDYGAVGDGQHDDTKAFGQAWDAACKSSAATLLVPTNKTFLVNNLAFQGQCEPGFIFQVDGNIIAPRDPEAWESKNVWLGFEHLNQFTLKGNGAIDGQGRDDCIAIGNGASDIVIKDVMCGPGHGISIGSLGKDESESEVHSVQVDGAVFRGTKNGLRIKTWQGGSGIARDITFENVQTENTENPIIIDQYYCDPPDPCKNQSSAVQVSNVTYKSISGTSATQAAIKLECSDSKPCTVITLSDVSLTVPSGDKATRVCQNAEGQSIGTVIPSGCFPSV